MSHSLKSLILKHCGFLLSIKRAEKKEQRTSSSFLHGTAEGKSTVVVPKQMCSESPQFIHMEAFIVTRKKEQQNEKVKKSRKKLVRVELINVHHTL